MSKWENKFLPKIFAEAGRRDATWAIACVQHYSAQNFQSKDAIEMLEWSGPYFLEDDHCWHIFLIIGTAHSEFQEATFVGTVVAAHEGIKRLVEAAP